MAVDGCHHSCLPGSAGTATATKGTAMQYVSSRSMLSVLTSRRGRWFVPFTILPALTLILTVAGSIAVLQAAHADEIGRGEQLAKRLCAVCHLNPGQGEKTGPGTIPGFVAVARREGQTLEGIVDWLTSVPPMMPNHHLSQDEMHALAFYILSLRDADVGQPSPGQ